MEETLNFGQISSILQQVTTSVVDSNCYEQQVTGRYGNPNADPYAIRGDGEMLTGGANAMQGWAIDLSNLWAPSSGSVNLTISMGDSAFWGSGNLPPSGALPMPWNGTGAINTTVILDSVSLPPDNSGMCVSIYGANPQSVIQSFVTPAVAGATGLVKGSMGIGAGAGGVDFEVLSWPASSATFTINGVTVYNSNALGGNGTPSLGNVPTGVARFGQMRLTGLGYNIPQSIHGDPIWLQKSMWQNGVTVQMPIALPGTFFNQRQGLIPLTRLPKVRVELTFNPKSYVLWSPNCPAVQNAVSTQSTDVATTSACNSANFNVWDYELSDIRVNAMYAQSPSLVVAYDANTWSYSYLNYGYFTAPAVSTTSLLMPISMPYKSSRFLIGVFVNPGQYVGLIATSGSALPTRQSDTAGVQLGKFPNNPNDLGCPEADATRWSNWYGLGGCYGGPRYVDNASGNLAQCYKGNFVNGVIASAFNFQQNNEWIYQQDLTKPVEYWRELTKIIPAVRSSTFFRTVEAQTTRQLYSVCLEAPELADQFVCGNRAMNGQSLGYVKVNLGTSPYRKDGGAPIGPIAGCLFQAWVCYDRVIKVIQGSGLTTSDY